MFRVLLILSTAMPVVCPPADGDEQTSYPVFGILQVDPDLSTRALRLQGEAAFEPVRQRTLIYSSDSAALRQVRDAKAREQFSAPVIVYMGGFTTNSGGATIVERSHRTGVGMIDLASLVRPVDAETTRIFVQNPRDREFPFVAGTAKVSDPDDTHQYAFWIRIDDEMMRVVDTNSESACLIVERGLESEAKPHAVGATVLTPVYLGKRGDEESVRHSNSWPGGPDYLRYAMDPASPAAQQFKANLIIAAMKTGYDGAWLDTFQTLPYNLCDPLGRRVTYYWDFRHGRRYDEASWVSAVQEMIRGMRRMVKAATGREPFLAANSVSGSYDRGGKQLFTAGDRPGLLDSYCFEDSYVRPRARRTAGRRLAASFEPIPVQRWRRSASFQRDAASDGLKALCMMGPAGYVAAYINPQLPNYERLVRFSWCSFLLTVDERRTTAFGLPLLITGRENGPGFLPLPQLFYLPIGDPTGSNDLSSMKVTGTDCYLRRFSGGIVVVNPEAAAEPQRVPLQADYVDPASNQFVNQVLLEGGDAVLLLQAKRHPQ